MTMDQPRNWLLTRLAWRSMTSIIDDRRLQISFHRPTNIIAGARQTFDPAMSKGPRLRVRGGLMMAPATITLTTTTITIHFTITTTIIPSINRSSKRSSHSSNRCRHHRRHHHRRRGRNNSRRRRRSITITIQFIIYIILQMSTRRISIHCRR
jgi:hypothetical protein